MAYYQPQEKLEFRWGPEGQLTIRLTYQGRKWKRLVKPKGLLTVIEAAALMQVSRAVVYQWIKARKLPARKVERPGSEKPVAMIPLRAVIKFAEKKGLELSKSWDR